MRVVIIDCRDDAEGPRRNTLRMLCDELGHRAEVYSEVWGDTPVANDQIWRSFERTARDGDLVVLHAGDEQTYAAEALQQPCMAFKPCLAYYGGVAPASDVSVYFDRNRPGQHALIWDTVELGLTAGSTEAKKMEECLRLILQEAHRPPEAVEKVYGDRELEGILNDLYEKLAPWNVVGDLKKDRDEQLGKYYEAKRGWRVTVTEEQVRRGKADAIVAHLESGAFPDERDAARLLYAGEIKIMRELVAQRPALVERLLQIAESETGSRPAFALALVRHACSEATTAARLRRLFDERATADPGLACHLVWRVLDDPGLPHDWHKRLFDYLMDNWDAWKQHLAEFKEPGPDGMIAVIRARLDDPTYPLSKKWIYLLCLPEGLASDRHEAERMIKETAGSDVENTRSVAQALLSRFY